MPPEEGMAGAGAAIAAAGEAAIERTSQQAAPDTTPQSPPPQAPAAPAQEAPPEGYEFEYGGQRHKLSRSDTDQLLRLGVEAARQAQESARQEAQAPQQQEPAQQQPDPFGDLSSRLQKLELTLSKHEQQRQVESILSEVDRALEGEKDFFGKFKDPEATKVMKGLVMLQQYNDPNMTASAAAKQVAKLMGKILDGEHGEYVQGKVQQAARKVETGGSVPSPARKEPGMKEFRNGSVMQNAIRRIMGQKV